MLACYIAESDDPEWLLKVLADWQSLPGVKDPQSVVLDIADFEESTDLPCEDAIREGRFAQKLIDRIFNEAQNRRR